MNKIRIFALGLLIAAELAGSFVADVSAQSSASRKNKPARTHTAAKPDAVTGASPKRPQTYGIYPAEDSLAMRRIRGKMAKIRRTRPTVGLVLSGGGAKGLAHVGVIQYLDSLGIPVDLVVGTSMGGLVGGLYAAGMDTKSLDSLSRSIDWNFSLTDKVPREYISYSEMKYKEKYQLSFPFFYSKDDYLLQRKESIQYSGEPDRYQNIHLGAGEEDPTKVIRDNLLGSLPSGFVFGQNVNNIFSSLTVGYQDPMNFDDLPIPFVCVATEMVSGKAKIWYGGKLNTALRSTMSIPGVFAPVKIDGMVLVDGGMRNNYPTDLARSMGADIVIGVDLSSGYKDYSSINNLGDIITQGVDMLGRASYEKNVEIPDVTIKPDLKEYNMMSFDKRSVDTIIVRGYRAAQGMSDELLKVKKRVGKYQTVLRNKSAVDLNKSKVMISGVEITGVNDNESLYLMKKIKIHAGESVGKVEIEDAVATIFGTKSFDYVTYELLGTDEPYRLKINCKRGPIHQFGIGARLDSEEIVSVLLNLGLNAHRLQGSALDLTGKIGMNPYFDIHYRYSYRTGPTLNVTGAVRWMDRNQFSLGTRRDTLAYLNLRQQVYASNIKWSTFDINLGLRNDLFWLSSIMADDVIGDYDMKALRNDYLSAFLTARRDTFDNGYYPTRGFTAGADYAFIFAGLINNLNPFHTLKFDVKGVVPIGDRFALIPSADFRFLFGNEIPLPYVNVIGGSLAGRYLYQQIPFIGVNYSMPVENIMFLVRNDFRYRITRNNYLTAIFNFSGSYSEWGDVGKINSMTKITGVGLEYAYNSIVGPLTFNLHWSNTTHRLGAYASIGLSF